MAPPRQYATLFDRAMAHTIILPWTGCYIYLGPLTASGGHAMMSSRVPGRRTPKAFILHREIYKQLVNPSLSTKRMLCHTCNISSCWRPDHLIEGGARRNVHDRAKNKNQKCNSGCYWCRQERKLGQQRLHQRLAS